MGNIANKYRVHEVAKDFGVSTKEITEILTKYAETPKNHMQVLEDRELWRDCTGRHSLRSVLYSSCSSCWSI